MYLLSGVVMEKYELDWLEEKFQEHGVEAEKQREEAMIRWKNEYSSDKIPEHMVDNFNLPRALLTLVREVRSLQRVVQDSQIRSFLKDRATYLTPEEGFTEANT